MRIAILSGTHGPLPGGPSQVLPYVTALATALEEHGHQVVRHDLDRLAVGPCDDCWRCWTEGDGSCVHDDDGQRLVGDVEGADLVLMATSVVGGAIAPPVVRVRHRLSPLARPALEAMGGGHRFVELPRRAVPRMGVVIERGEGTDEGDLSTIIASFDADAALLDTHLAVVAHTSDTVATTVAAIEGPVR